MTESTDVPEPLSDIDLPGTLPIPLRWRFECPHEHRQLRRWTRDGTGFCQKCGQSYRPSEITDLKTGESLA